MIERATPRFPLVPVEACPWCGDAGPEQVASRADGVRVLRCGSCSLVFTGAVPADPAVFYDDAYFRKSHGAEARHGYEDYGRDVSPWSFRWLTALARVLVPQPGRLLDVGCALGDLLVMARADGFDAVGSELNETAAADARAKGFDVRAGAFEPAAWAPGSFDVVTAVEVLEHVSDVRGFLDGLRRVVGPTGVVALLVPTLTDESLDAHGSAARAFAGSLEHTCYFSPRTLRRVTEEVFGPGTATVVELEDDDDAGQTAALAIVRRSGGGNRPEHRIEQAFACGALDPLGPSELLAVALAAARFGRRTLAGDALAAAETRADAEAFDLVSAQVAFHAGRLDEALERSFRRFAAASARRSDVEALLAQEVLSGRLRLGGVSADVPRGVREALAARGPDVASFRSPAGRGRRRGWEERELASRAARIEQLEARVRALAAELDGTLASRGWKVVVAARRARRSLRRLAPGSWQRSAHAGRMPPEVVPPVATTAPPSEFPFLVSVVIPVLDKGRDVAAAVRSVRSQTVAAHTEIVVWDDGSTDPETIAAIRAVAKLPSVTVRRSENRGVAHARNAGLALARGWLLCCLDADDEIEPTYLEKAAAVLLSDPSTSLAYSWVRLVDDTGSSVWQTRDLDPDRILRQNHVSVAAVYARELLQGTGGYRTDMREQGYEDWELWAHAAKKGFRGRVVPEPLLRYRASDDPRQSMYARARARHEELLADIRSLHPELARQENGEGEPVGRRRRRRVLAPEAWDRLRRSYPAGEKRPVVVATSAHVLGGGDILLDELVRHWTVSGRTVLVFGTRASREELDRFPSLLDLTPYAYNLPRILPKEHWAPFVAGAIRSLPEPILLNHGSGWLYDVLFDLRQALPEGISVVDKHFNDVGHFAPALDRAFLVDRTVVCHEGLRQRFVAAGRDPERVVTIHDHAPFDSRPLSAAERQATRARLGVPDGAAVVLFVGRLSEEKRPDWVLRLARVLDGRDAVVVVVGDGPLAPRLRGRVEGTRNVHWVRHVPRTEIRRLYGVASVLVLPSAVEGVPLTALEALDMGVPVVASRVGGLTELESLEGVELVAADDFDGFARAVGETLARPPERVTSDPRFSAEAMCAAWDRLLDTVGSGAPQTHAARAPAWRSAF